MENVKFKNRTLGKSVCDFILVCLPQSLGELCAPLDKLSEKINRRQSILLHHYFFPKCHRVPSLSSIKERS